MMFCDITNPQCVLRNFIRKCIELDTHHQSVDFENPKTYRVKVKPFENRYYEALSLGATTTPSDVYIELKNHALRCHADTCLFPTKWKFTNSEGKSQPYVVLVVRDIFDEVSWVFNNKTKNKNDVSTMIRKAVENGESVLFTGQAGTGKSYLIREILYDLKVLNKTVAVTASTGMAAFSVGGCTLHKFSGGGLCDAIESMDSIIERVSNNRHAVDRWKKTQVLIIDEISMVSDWMFELMDRIARTVRKLPNVPWGGMQVVLVGDFLQLPPVSKKGEKEKRKCFLSDSWKRLHPKIFVLAKIYRQISDQMYCDILSRLRENKQTIADDEIFIAFDRPLDAKQCPIHLFAKRDDVDEYNRKKLDELDGPETSYQSIDWTKEDGEKGNEKRRRALLRECTMEETLNLKINAQVTLLRNLNDRLPNGRTGVVSKLDERGVIVTFPAVYGHPEISKLITQKIWKKTVCRKSSFDYGENEDDERNVVIATRRQIPLKLSYALTIHKSQGQTLDSAVVHLTNCFAEGHMYTALSRVRSSDYLQVIGYQAGFNKVDRKSVLFYKDALTIKGQQVVPEKRGVKILEDGDVESKTMSKKSKIEELLVF